MLIELTDINRAALHDRVAVVTGAGQGIGRETARLLALLGASVVIAEQAESGRETEHLIRAEGGAALFVQTDVSDPASMDALRQQCLKAFGHVDILVNNAEAFSCKRVLEHTTEEWDHIFAVNLRGAFLGIKAFLPAMLERRRGIIITMESADGMPYLAPYLASKVGLRSLAFSLAQELGAEHGVWVYCFGAGMVETPGGVAAFRELAPRYDMSVEEFIGQSAPGGRLILGGPCDAIELPQLGIDHREGLEEAPDVVYPIQETILGLELGKQRDCQCEAGLAHGGLQNIHVRRILPDHTPSDIGRRAVATQRVEGGGIAALGRILERELIPHDVVLDCIDHLSLADIGIE